MREFSGKLPSLKHLDLTGNDIAAFNAELPNLEFLNLSDNKLVDFNPNLPKVEKIDIDNNLLETLDLNAPKLIILLASSNKLTHFDHSGIPNIKRLYLRDNKLTKFDCPSVATDVDISGNYIYKVNINSSQLIKFAGKNNHMSEISIIANKLERLYLSNNLICIIPEPCQIPNINVIDLGDNPIPDYEGTFYDIVSPKLYYEYWTIIKNQKRNKLTKSARK